MKTINHSQHDLLKIKGITVKICKYQDVASNQNSITRIKCRVLLHIPLPIHGQKSIICITKKLEVKMPAYIQASFKMPAYTSFKNNVNIF